MFYHILLTYQIYIEVVFVRIMQRKQFINCRSDQKNSFTVISLLSLLCLRVSEEQLFQRLVHNTKTNLQGHQSYIH